MTYTCAAEAASLASGRLVVRGERFELSIPESGEIDPHDELLIDARHIVAQQDQTPAPAATTAAAPPPALKPPPPAPDKPPSEVTV